jgi:benzylsuccinate CoA-transferase BbsE subunit
MSEPAPPAALDDLLVLDLSLEIGAYCTKLLADLGARVIRVEPPGGDPLRRKGPYYRDQPGPETSLRHFHYNTSKESITLDIERPEGAALLRRLATRADVLVEGYPPGHLPGLGLGYAALAEANPRLIMASITPFGQTGPYRGYAGTDLIGMAMGGVMAISGHDEDPPNQPPALQGYHMASIVAAAGITMALCARDLDTHRRGTHLDISMQEAVSVATLQSASAAFYTLLGRVPRRMGGQVRTVYRCRDGRWISLSVPPPFFGNFLAWLDEEGLLGDIPQILPEMPGWATQQMPPIRAAIDALALRYDRDDLFHEGQRRRLLALPVNDVDDLVRDEQLHARGYFVPVAHPALDDTLTYPGAPFSLSETPWRIARAAPMLGEHNEPVFLGDLGLSPDELAALRKGGIV